MRKWIAAAAVALTALCAAASPAIAQSSPGLAYGQVPTPAQWNSYFAAKQDFLGFTPLNPSNLAGASPITVVSAAGVVTVGININSSFAISLNTLTLANQISAAGPIGDGTHVAQITFNNAGQLTAVSSVLITGASPGGAAGGDLGGTYPNPSVLKVHGATYPASPSVNTVPVVTNASGGGTITYEAVPNAALAGIGTSGSTIPLNNTANIFSAQQTVNLNSASLPASLPGAIINLGQADGVVGRVQVNAFGSIAAFTGAIYGGTLASPSAVGSAVELASVNSYAYNGAALVGPIASFRSYTAEAISSGHQGSKACIGTTPIASTSLADGLCQNNDRGITLGSPTGGSKGADTLNAAGAIYVNNAAVLTGNQSITLSGDISGTGTTSITTTLASVATAGTTGSSTAIPVITIDVKGRTTSITTAAVIAPAGTLTGATMAANVLASSLTSVGTLTGGATGAGFTVALGTSTISGLLTGTNGGTGVNNGSFTITLAGNVTHAGAFARTITATAATNSTLPAGTHTLAGLDVAQTWSALQGFNDNDFGLNGSSSGNLVLRAAAAAGSSVIRFPAGSTDFSATGGTSQVVKQTSVGGALTVAQLGFSDLSGALALTQVPTGGSSGQVLSTNGSGTGSYVSTKSPIGGASVNTVNNASTGYFTNNECSGQQSCQIPIPYAGTVKGCQYISNGTPASGQTYTFTLMKNGSATANTAQITSATPLVNGSAILADTTHTVSFAQGDVYVFQVVVSATAGANNFAASCEFDSP